MGSAAGRRKCCESFFLRGYEMGLLDTRSYAGKDSEPWTESALMQAAGTVSRSFCGLFRSGYELGCEDRRRGAKRRSHAYYDYKVKKANAQDILNLLDGGFILRYERSSGWPNHPFIVRSPAGGIVYRRTAADLVLAQDAEYYKYRKLLTDVMAEAIDAGAFDKRNA